MNKSGTTLDILVRRKDMIAMCYRCGLCRTVCPSFQELGVESASPRGRVQFARALLECAVPLDHAVKERMLDCLNCMRCTEVCPSGVKTNEIVVDTRAELVRRGDLNIFKKLAFATVMKSVRLLSLSAWAGAIVKKWFYDSSEFLKTLVPSAVGYEDKKFPSPVTKQSQRRWPELVSPPDGKPVMRVGYFIGCATNLIFTDVADATIAVLVKNSIEVVIPRGQACCGIPVYSSGDFATARGLAETNLRVFKGKGIDCIVTDCASCSAALKHEVQEFLDVGPFEVPVYDLNEFLCNIIDIQRDFGPVPFRVTYHDPCHLKRGQGIFREPRKLITMVPGVEFVEMENADSCCGGAGTFSYTHHGLSRKVGERKAAAIRKTGADTVVTPCPSCTMQLEDLLNHEGVGLPVMHPVEIIARGYEAKKCQDSHTAERAGITAGR